MKTKKYFSNGPGQDQKPPASNAMVNGYHPSRKRRAKLGLTLGKKKVRGGQGRTRKTD